MTALSQILGTQVVSRSDAEKIGKVEGAVIDVPARTVTAWQIGKGRKAQFVDHAHLTGIGDAAVIVDEAASLREAASPLEEQTAKGHHDLLKSLVLNEAGDALGHVSDVEIETDRGAIVTVTTDSTTIPAGAMLGFGSYALVVALSTG